MQNRDLLLIAIAICLAFGSAQGCPKQIKNFFAGPDAVVHKVEYKGCFPGRPHPTAVTHEDGVRLWQCNSHCYKAGYKFMGTATDKCFCETYVDVNEKLDDGLCLPCTNEPQNKCGGDGVYSAYSTAEKY